VDNIEAHVNVVASDVFDVLAIYITKSIGVTKLAAEALLNSIPVIVTPAGRPAACNSACVNSEFDLDPAVVDVAENR
jgi:hypothetical protein